MSEQFVGMSRDAFDRHYDEIKVIVNLLLDQPERRKLWRQLAIYERGGKGELIGDILNIPDYGPVLVSRMTVEEAAEDHSLDDTRQSPWRGLEPVTGDPDETFEMTSRRTRFRVHADYLIRCIESGHRKIKLKPGLTATRGGAPAD